MTDKKPEYDKLPATVETTSFRKTTDEYTFTLATPRKYEEEAKRFMARISSMGVIFFVPCNADQVDNLLQGSESRVQGQVLTQNSELKTDNCIVDVEVMATVLGMTERNVQLHAEKGTLVRNARGQYDTLATCGSLWKSLKELETGKNDDHNRERTEAMRLKRMNNEVAYLERIGKLVNAELVMAAIEKGMAEARQRWLFMPKHLSPKLENLSLQEIESMLDEYSRSSLAQLAAVEIPRTTGDGGVPDHGAAAEAHREPVGGPKAGTKRKKRSRSR